jgi:predicted dithiol-disulfide oxidoreductase (DUF899 family)
MGWEVPWYSGQESADELLAGRSFAMLACYLRHGDRVLETYWTRGRGFEVMAPNYGLLDMRSKQIFRTNGRPTAQWSRLEAGRSDDLGIASG